MKLRGVEVVAAESKKCNKKTNDIVVVSLNTRTGLLYATYVHNGNEFPVWDTPTVMDIAHIMWPMALEDVKKLIYSSAKESISHALRFKKINEEDIGSWYMR